MSSKDEQSKKYVVGMMNQPRCNECQKELEEDGIREDVATTNDPEPSVIFCKECF